MMMVTKTNEEMLNRVDELNGLLMEGEKPFRIVAHDCFKNNGTKVGYTLCSDERNAAPTVYFESMKDIWESSTDVISFLEDVFNNNHLDGLDLKVMMSKDYILSHVKPKLISQNNVTDVKANDIAYGRFLDMLVVFVLEVESMSDENGVATCTLKNQMIQSSGIETDELYEQAVRNLEKDYQIMKMEDVIRDIMGFPEECDFDMPVDNNHIQMLVLSNVQRLNGASVMLSDKVLEEVSKKFENGEFVILPSSIHECIAVPAKDGEAEYLKNMVTEVNDNEVSADEILTYNVYIYRNGSLEIFE
jgi:hypothetical protein